MNPASPPQSNHAISVGLLFAATLQVMAMATISPALPGIAIKYASTPGVESMTRYLVAAPALSALFFAPVSGMISDRFGHGRILRLSVVAYALLGSSGLFLNQLELLLLSRFLLGLSLALVITSQTALIGEHFTGDSRQRFLGLQVSARNAGGLIFVGLAGVLAGLSAQSAFGVYALTILFLPFIWQAGKPPEPSAGTRHPAPKLSAPWLRPVYRICLLQAVILILFFTMPTQIPFALRAQGFDDPRLTSLSMSGLMIAGAFAGVTYGWHVRRFGQIITVAIGFGTLALGFAVMIEPGFIPLMLGPTLVGAGYSVLMACTAAMALTEAKPEHRGFVLGLVASAIFLGQSVSPMISTPLIRTIGFQHFFAAYAGLSTLCALMFVFRSMRCAPKYTT